MWTDLIFWLLTILAHKEIQNWIVANIWHLPVNSHAPCAPEDDFLNCGGAGAYRVGVRDLRRAEGFWEDIGVCMQLSGSSFDLYFWNDHLFSIHLHACILTYIAKFITWPNNKVRLYILWFHNYIYNIYIIYFVFILFRTSSRYYPCWICVWGCQI